MVNLVCVLSPFALAISALLRLKPSTGPTTVRPDSSRASEVNAALIPPSRSS